MGPFLVGLFLTCDDTLTRSHPIFFSGLPVSPVWKVVPFSPRFICRFGFGVQTPPPEPPPQSFEIGLFTLFSVRFFFVPTGPLADCLFPLSFFVAGATNSGLLSADPPVPPRMAFFVNLILRSPPLVGSLSVPKPPFSSFGPCLHSFFRCPRGFLLFPGTSPAETTIFAPPFDIVVSCEDFGLPLEAALSPFALKNRSFPPTIEVPPPEFEWWFVAPGFSEKTPQFFLLAVSG